ncbi:glucose-1-phosphate adenylyltransferase [Fuchsiella alkaliacetigena]|nr:glucose-1-phosphate adenylyltransferase [Fuchsiella alkaliacetigena]
MDVLALILAGGKGSRLDILSQSRAKPNLPFGGRYRLIDFSLSNCVNSDIYEVGVLTQYLPRSLNAHLGIGRPWKLDRKHGGITLLHPRTGRKEEWYQGTAHAVYQNRDFIKAKAADYVVILSGDHVYKMDYRRILDYHQQQNADLTIAAQAVPMEEANRFGILETDEQGRVLNFQEKPAQPASNLASLGIYIFDTEVLLAKLDEYCCPNKSDFGKHIIPPLIEEAKTCAYQFEGYWQDVGTLESFWKTNLDLIHPQRGLDLDDPNWKIYTRDSLNPAASFGSEAEIGQSLVANGAYINGKVSNSVIFPGAVVERGAVVEDSIVFADTRIEAGATVNKCLIDEEVVIGTNSYLGFGREIVANMEKPELLNCGLTVIGKAAKIPPRVKVGRNCRVAPEIRENDFERDVVFSGNTITKDKKWSKRTSEGNFTREVIFSNNAAQDKEQSEVVLTKG